MILEESGKLLAKWKVSIITIFKSLPCQLSPFSSEKASKKLKIDQSNVTIVKAKSFNVGGRFVNQSEIRDIAMYKCIDIFVAVVGAPFDRLRAGYFGTTCKGWTGLTKHSECGNWRRCTGYWG